MIEVSDEKVNSFTDIAEKSVISLLSNEKYMSKSQWCAHYWVCRYNEVKEFADDLQKVR